MGMPRFAEQRASFQVGGLRETLPQKEAQAYFHREYTTNLLVPEHAHIQSTLFDDGNVEYMEHAT